MHLSIQYLTVQPNPEVREVCKAKIFASVLVYTSFPLIMQHDHNV